MKQKDIALIIVIIFVSGVVSYIVSGMLFKNSSQSTTVQTVSVINPDFNVSQVNPEYINSSSVDPTQLIQIGNSNNPNPFANSP